MEKEDWLRLAEKLIENTPELITAITGYLTYKLLKKEKKRKPQTRKSKR